MPFCGEERKISRHSCSKRSSHLPAPPSTTFQPPSIISRGASHSSLAEFLKAGKRGAPLTGMKDNVGEFVPYRPRPQVPQNLASIKLLLKGP